MGRDIRTSDIVKTSLPIPDSDDRAVLFYWACSDEARLKNVARIDRLGGVVWRADLPGDAPHDCFVSLKVDGTSFSARTYSGLVARVDPDGLPIS